MEQGKLIIPLALFLTIASLLLAGPASGTAGLADEDQACLSCHERHGLMVTFENKEFVDVYVDPAQIKSSVHHSLPCSSCHPDFAGGKHPLRTFHSKTNYQTKAALVCRRCHTDRQLTASNVHTALFNQEKTGTAIVCTNCHGSHAITHIAKAAIYSNEEAYCLKCHGYALTMTFRNGETLSGTINMSSLQASVHSKLSCSDCHYGFSSEEHPKRNFSTRRDYTLAASDNCRRCHFDKYTKTMEGIHYTMLSQGDLAAPVCIDCHGSHGISRIQRAVTAKWCQQCHAGIYDIYAKSVHGKALLSESNPDVPVCADCHTAHTIEDPRTLNYQERVPDICSNCHANRAVVGKYGLSTAVVDTYLSDFHGVTLKFYRLEQGVLDKPARPMAVCTDCHGTHNINSTIGPDATIIKTNLVKRCQKCHAEAPKNFPDSWLSHYEPSLERAPLVFFITLAYKIFIPVLVAGLVLQILLHIWRYVANR